MTTPASDIRPTYHSLMWPVRRTWLVAIGYSLVPVAFTAAGSAVAQVTTPSRTSAATRARRPPSSAWLYRSGFSARTPCGCGADSPARTSRRKVCECSLPAKLNSPTPLSGSSVATA
jgi:hypothetical protein